MKINYILCTINCRAAGLYYSRCFEIKLNTYGTYFGAIKHSNILSACIIVLNLVGIIIIGDTETKHIECFHIGKRCGQLARRIYKDYLTFRKRTILYLALAEQWH